MQDPLPAQRPQCLSTRRRHGFTGPCLRASGVNYDVRKSFPYLVYDQLDFEVPLGEKGDNFDRYMVRMKEMEQSLRIIEQAVIRMLPKTRLGRQMAKKLKVYAGAEHPHHAQQPQPLAT